MGLASTPQRIRSLPRLPQIVRVLVKYGFGDIVSRVGLDRGWHTLKAVLQPEAAPEFEALRTEERFRRALEELGPTFIKLGQVMATRPDLLPMPLILELRQLQDKVTPFDTEGVRQLVEAELGRPIGEVFRELDTKPLAAASIAQVHRGVLADGRRVVVKVQRPNLERVIETDLTLLYWLAEVAEERLPEVRRYRPVGLVTEFHHSILKEIDFETEAYHIRRFARNFADDPDIYVPQVIAEATTPRILCEEFIDGTPLSDPSIKQRTDLDLVKIAKTGLRVLIEQALVHGFFHADPHPGNVFVLPGNRVCFIDYGMMGILDQQRIDELLVFLVSILTRDVDKMIGLFHRLELIGEEADIRAMRRDVDDLIRRFETTDLARLDVGRFLQQVFEVITRHDVHVPSDLLLVGKALATIEGIGRDLYPELNPLEEIRPLILRVYLKRLSDPTYFTRAPRRFLEEALLLLEAVPRDLRLTLRKLRQGEVRLRLDLDGYTSATRASAQATNRLALSLVACTLGAGSLWLLARADLSGLIGSFPLMPVLGVLGLGLAGLLTLGLLIGTIRSGGL